MRITLLLALVFATSSAYASAVTALSTRVQNVVVSAGLKTNVARTAIGKINVAGALAVSGANITKLEDVVNKIEDSLKVASKSNDDSLNGISKSQRLEALLLVYVALAKNYSEGTPNANLEKVLTGELFMRSIAPVAGNLGEAQYAKFINVMKLYVEQGRSAEDASREVTGDSLAAFADACGGSSAAARR